MVEFTVESLTRAEVDRLRAIFGPLTDSVRDLIDATIRSEAAEDVVAQAKSEIESATARLRSRQLDGPFGVRISEGDQMPWGNPVIGLRNPIAPPLVLHRDADGRVHADFHLGAAYEGPPGHVHGGISALVLDHVLGQGASTLENPRLTGTISLRYLRPTPLGGLHAEARIVRTEGVKTFAVGHLADADGVTVEAEGVFITPKWAR
jgi:acyl-coenzyme A thioesterase PaaI-like protein